MDDSCFGHGIEAIACLILAEDSFMAGALRAFKHKNIGMLKAHTIVEKYRKAMMSLSHLLSQKESSVFWSQRRQICL